MFKPSFVKDVVAAGVGVSEVPVEPVRLRPLGTFAAADLNEDASRGLGEVFRFGHQCSPKSRTAVAFIDDQRGDPCEGTFDKQRCDADGNQSDGCRLSLPSSTWSDLESLKPARR